MSQSDQPDIIPPSPSATDYLTDPSGKPLIPDVADPIALFKEWMAAAREAEPNDSNAMSLATVDADGMPDVRIVLLKEVTEAGFVFFTNLESAKGQQLTETPKAALGFHWKSQRRQVRVRGTVMPVSEEAADEYFATRAAQSRISAIASDQSRPLADRAEFEQRVAELSEIFGDGPDIPRPEFWGGFRVVPVEIEFWQDQAFRMHDRLKFVRSNEGWTTGRLYP
ncbi:MULTISPECIES: pyridoxamine 5'-phosphate oxidase [unclassified Hyphomonas]|jgi:pyridoxamine 5'-phosphate oxidase|uniref:Pyridoxamine 5'-phosphate oxidase n=2 Tax=root TaxID=1 RepID=A0A160U1F2_9ZZZZ|nr:MULTISPECIES: pyridoxamine 5'-phosphate oxidase [unclassified Hyphomonas]MAN91942.1 pyridoxamine 5'-phosphate oxidase [Hyphomonadaceae bacterium]MAL45244.1 pyridoxamine 5'-phosphate oxidase [Hyphomonas sp.]MBG68177.1 pyridoxamine 5'-phosphate oxidase [Hyphomonas sp.]MBO6581748.1 pyridoxamine 5'-phosphate oxidase [Hyphomonas sp.]MDF1806499.1 pyridoxamine 5'-phosphate oxidase [Hyphomonas sp.]|tara:strand:- start:10157 stop:10828 length:672 start_codon:yes stop_codon:yes gene_type:complete